MGRVTSGDSSKRSIRLQDDRSSKQGNQKLRQTVKELTVSTERLRAVNLRAIAKGLKQEQ